ncbi:Lipid A 3-O-deacylase (PagL) [Granulicella rosea]|uniref:Lipid A 3-O-deacylase (PagL) n=1 Tax=Granulicella rosea TaxID=474952 RepID=A0A239JTW4_9BACT|nr:acyloxyacyl hydrolase [Granulicella rosea]SNT09250.1 Lipid A 3-O-deacylase (PagL) [Granulicella rosea]
MTKPSAAPLLAALLAASTLHAQSSKMPDTESYSFRDSLSSFAEYSNTSSHIILGVSGNRRLIALGGTYSRRLLHSRYVDWHYDLDVRPLTLLEEPTARITVVAAPSVTFYGPSDYDGPIEHACTSSTVSVAAVPPIGPISGNPAYTVTTVCETRWTYAGGVSPLGQRLNFAPRHRLQPFILGNAGFMAATRDIPSYNSESFNFTFEFGAGFEFFENHHRSWAVDYRIHHLSNAYRGQNNPGIDSQIVKLTYSFGR